MPPASTALAGPSLFTSVPGLGASLTSSCSRELGSAPSVSKSEEQRASSASLGEMPELWRRSCGLPSWEDAGLGLGPRLLLSDSGLLGCGEEAGLPQGPEARVQGAGSWGHPASPSPLAWEIRGLWGQEGPSSVCQSSGLGGSQSCTGCVARLRLDPVCPVSQVNALSTQGAAHGAGPSLSSREVSLPS